MENTTKFQAKKRVSISKTTKSFLFAYKDNDILYYVLELCEICKIFPSFTNVRGGSDGKKVVTVCFHGVPDPVFAILSEKIDSKFNSIKEENNLPKLDLF